MRLDKKNKSMRARKNRVRGKISGTSDRLRLAVYFSCKHIYAQCINDDLGVTVVSLSTMSKDFTEKCSANVAGATALGSALGAKAVAVGVSNVVFDRGVRRYHGCVEAFANAARQSGLKF